MTKKAAAELEEMFGVTAQQITAWDEAAAEGNFPGEPVGETIRGRPLKFGEPLKFVGFRDTESGVRAMDERAAALGLSRSDYLRSLVHKDLALA